MRPLFKNRDFRRQPFNHSAFPSSSQSYNPLSLPLPDYLFTLQPFRLTGYIPLGLRTLTSPASGLGRRPGFTHRPPGSPRRRVMTLLPTRRELFSIRVLFMNSTNIWDTRQVGESIIFIEFTRRRRWGRPVILDSRIDHGISS